MMGRTGQFLPASWRSTQIAAFVKTFEKFPPSQKSTSVQVEDVSKMSNSQSHNR